jgi:NAD(P)-dependent dehydrogenase (short-subunit alcohol dehydrogenase family)
MVTIADIDLDAARAVQAELGEVAHVVECDVTSTASVNAAIEQAVDRFGQLDVLVNTAGGGGFEDGIEHASDDDWLDLIDLNLLNVMRCVRAALSHLRNSAFGGNVVTIGSINGVAAFGGYAYSAAKAGLELVTKNLAADYGREELRFNLIAPATVDTRVWDRQPESRERLSKLYPLGRIGRPEDIAAAVAFLASDDAAWISGITLPVDGAVSTGPKAFLTQDGSSG